MERSENFWDCLGIGLMCFLISIGVGGCILIVTVSDKLMCK